MQIEIAVAALSLLAIAQLATADINFRSIVCEAHVKNFWNCSNWRFVNSIKK